MKKGFIFTLDALVAALILIGGVVLVTNAFITDTNTVELQSISEDTANILDVIPTKETTDNITKQLIANGTITDPNVSILTQIGYYWAQGNIPNARLLAQYYLDKAYSGGIRLSIGGTTIYERNGTGKDVLVTRRMITGIAEGEALKGSSASAYLRKIKSKRNAVFLPFGGFVGEGNISVTTNILPSDATITDIFMEGDVHQEFDVYVNNNYCTNIAPTPTFLTVNAWNLSNCTTYMNPNITNTISLNHTTTMNGSYVAGGYVKVLYTTDEINNVMNESIYTFPYIEGLINLFDGFYVDGNVTSMNATLHFLSNYTSYLTIGNTSWQFPGSMTPQTVFLNESQMLTAFTSSGMTFADMSQNTVPLRFGIGSVVITGSPSDTIMVTDTSGSMDDCVDPSCTPPGDQKKIDAAINSTNNFISFMLNSSAVLVGLVEFASSVKSDEALTDNETLLTTQVSAYTANGGTCICCGVNRAAELLDAQSLLIPRGTSDWRYNTDDLVSPPAGWTDLTYDDSGWNQGTTAIGWLEGTLNTAISCCSRWYVGDYYHRKQFNVTNATDISNASLYVRSNDGADVYLNGNLIDNDYGNSHSSLYWNRDTISVNPTFFVEGENIIAVRQYHGSQWWHSMAFDLELVASYNGTAEARTKNIVVMSDGAATVQCAQQGNGSSSADAIQSACDAYNDYGINVYTVGFGTDADNVTLQAMAACANGEYFPATNATALTDAFSSIADAIIDSSSTQASIIQGTITETILYGNSTIDAAYMTLTNEPQPNEIAVTVQTDQLANCSDTVEIFSGVRFLDARVNSYSGDFWTSTVAVNNQTVYNLSKYSQIYTSLGDPYQIRIPVDVLVGGNNTINVTIGTDASNASPICSMNNSIVYTVAINLSTERTHVVANADGCNWVVAFVDNTTLNLTIPTSYTGNNSCSYQPGNITYDAADAYQLGVAKVLENLDFKNEGMLSISLDAQDLEIVVTTISQVPYLWGPTLATLEVWR